MAAREVIVAQQIAALGQIAEVLEKHAPEKAAQLRTLTPVGSVPNSARGLDETITFLAESVAVLARLVDQHIEQTKSRPRGRPRKKTDDAA